MKTFNLTVQQIKDVFSAGFKSGENYSCSYNSGSSYYGVSGDEIQAFSEFINVEKSVLDDTYVHWNEIKEMIRD